MTALLCQSKSNDLLYIFFLADTDSVIFIQRPGDDEINTGNHLGCLTDEVEPGKKIIQFRASAPKSYALRMDDCSEQIRMKGISLHFLNKQIFNFDSFSDLIAGEKQALETVMQEEFRREKRRGIVYKRPHCKTITMKFIKRCLLSEQHYTLPYGYKGCLL